jgi:predicted secreted Zn-dependent protease
LSTSDAITIVAAAASILLAVIGTLLRMVWSSLSSKLREIDTKLDKHIEADIEAHERIKGAEVRIEATKEQLTQVDARRHRYQVDNDEQIRDLRQVLADKMSDTHKWITERVIEALKP